MAGLSHSKVAYLADAIHSVVTGTFRISPFRTVDLTLPAESEHELTKALLLASVPTARLLPQAVKMNVIRLHWFTYLKECLDFAFSELQCYPVVNVGHTANL